MISNWWHKVSVSKKIYGVVGIMAVLIATELFTLFFAMNTLSAVRGFVGGEGLWSKAQKTSFFSLYKYALVKDESQYELFLNQLKIPMGDHEARLEMEKPQMDEEKVQQGFLRGGNHPNDLHNMVKLFRRFSSEPHMARAIVQWRNADDLIVLYMDLARQVHEEIIKKKHSNKKIEKLMDQIYDINIKLNTAETEFSYSLGEASRWLEHVLMIILILAVFTIESTGILLTVTFVRRLTASLNDLNDAAISVSNGDFTARVNIKSQDEVGILGESLNKMIQSLDNQIKEKENAESANKTKNLFLANMSHEIRTPLNAILGFSSLLTDNDVSLEEKKRYGEIIKRTGSSLNTIINDILDVAKVEAEQVEIQMQEFSLEQLLSDLYEVLVLRTAEKNIGLVFEKIGDVSENIFCDPIRLKQILSNIVGNAIKFTSKGEIKLTYRAEKDKLIFEILDTGPGISPQNQQYLFKAFSQTDSSVSKKYGGTGLGLFIAKRLAQLLGGNAGLKSSSEHGSVFFVEINYRPMRKKMAPKQSIADEQLLTEPKLFKDKKILVAEDVLDNQLLIRMFLKHTEALVTFANDGQEALDLVAKEKFDLILMDMQMPIVDGFTATEKLRHQGITIPIIALTGYAMKEDKDKCLEVGCNSYLSKPFDKISLIKAIFKMV